MNTVELKKILEEVSSGAKTIDDALLELKIAPYKVELGFAQLDLHRSIRRGATEVIYGAGKTPEQIAEIVCALQTNGNKNVLISRLSAEHAEVLIQQFQIELEYHPLSHVGIVGQKPEIDGIGRIIIATGGTSDIPVAEEALLTAQMLGNDVLALYDIGVAGLHRTLSHLNELMSARVIIAVAGMEGALPSVLAGLVACPVIAVPTSVGYGASFGGLSALLSMLNSCAAGVSVVNIDNGFGAAYQASLINHNFQGV